jgi:hypothetical protein
VSTVAVCPGCGWQSKPTTPGRARQGLNAHSCDLHRRRQARARRVAERAGRDGPTRECHHEQARHRHGTRLAYALDRCRCRPCRAANNQAQRAYQRAKAERAWGTAPAGWVDAEPARAHVRALMAAGAGWKRVSRLSGVPSGTLSKLLYGDPGTGTRPTRRVRPRTAQALLRLRADDLLADGAHVDSAGTRRRLQALVSIGWSLSELGRRIGVAPTNMTAMLDRSQVTAGRARTVRTLYEQLWDQAPAEHTRHQRTSATKARRLAHARGWLPPMAWDDDLIDLPDEALAAALDRRTAGMSEPELASAWTGRYRLGDQTPLTEAACREKARRAKARRAKVRKAAAA